MVLKIKRISEIIGLKVFTDSGDFFGEIEEASLEENKVAGWKIKIAKESSLGQFLGGARGIIIPHQFVKAIGDVVVISKSSIPSREEMSEEETIGETIE